ncbi:hypothetical protein HUG17_5481 [Dermatophagoides farinae]|uniref:Uncharacterized protein n=1 Tax=Dermatophagoides farinae TaxID=6954 RepID=A0A9D4P1M0_DERFA|nr:hypothetical protein HUG17_5481 [Dermatophagoides farinae]
MAINLVNIHHQYIINSVIPILVFMSFVLSCQITQINAFEDLNNDELSTFCVIGQLSKCNDDEDCAELDENQQKDHLRVNLPIGQRIGICVCRESDHCKRNTGNMQAQSDHLSIVNDTDNDSNLKLIMGISSAMAIIGFLSFIIYYYGIRYGLITHYARRLGLANRNTQIEDNQLLNRISINRDGDDVELTL